jgi:hypothetical protein
MVWTADESALQPILLLFHITAINMGLVIEDLTVRQRC